MVKDCYIESKSDPGHFAKLLASKMYGDMLSEFKLNLKREYNSGNRKTRLSLSEFDPVGYGIIISNLN